MCAKSRHATNLVIGPHMPGGEHERDVSAAGEDAAGIVCADRMAQGDLATPETPRRAPVVLGEDACADPDVGARIEHIVDREAEAGEIQAVDLG
jgi:hypothetical protein